MIAPSPLSEVYEVFRLVRIARQLFKNGRLTELIDPNQGIANRQLGSRVAPHSPKVLAHMDYAISAAFLHLGPATDICPDW